MKNGEFRVIIAILTLLIALGLFLGGFTIYNRVGVEQPLTKELHMIEAVEKVDINKDKVYKIEVQLNRVENIQTVYQDLVKTIAAKLDKNEYELVLADQPNAKLNDLSAQLQPAIYQALANNQFLWLDEKLAEISGEAEITYSLFIDDKCVYIQLIDGDSYTYQVLTRPSAITTSL